MKTFSPADISNRFLTKLASQQGWTQIVEESAVVSLGEAIGEVGSEIARYGEYLLQEAKWSRARNTNSLLLPAQYLAYKAKRKISAIGELVVSHDPQLANAGISTTVSLYTYADLDENLTEYSGSASDILIPKGTRFKTSSGTEYVSTQEVTLQPGDKYKRIPVIQGVLVSQNRTMKGNPFEELRIRSPNVEAAVDSVSSQFFRVLATITNTTQLIEFTEYEDIYLAEYDEYAYSTSVSKDYSYISLQFGNNIAGRIVPRDSTVTVQYLETKGLLGNVESKYIVNNVVDSFPIALYCSNFSSILGGKNEDSLESIRANAPQSYLTSGSIITADSYSALINSIPYIYTSVVYTGIYHDPLSNTDKDAILYSAVDTEGNAPVALTMEADFDSRVKKKNSPLDYVRYTTPMFLNLKIGVKAKTITSDANIQSLKTGISSLMYSSFGIMSQSFGNSFDYSHASFLINSNYETQKTSLLIESYVDLLPSTFIADNTRPGFYKSSFYFDRSFLRLKSFSDGVLHALKINIKFLCAECEDKSRTLFVIKEGDSYKVVQYELIENITDYDYMYNYVINPALPPYEIPVGQMTNPVYIPIAIEVNLDSFIGDDLDNTELGMGTISIPNFMPPSYTDLYVNFAGADPTELDAGVQIHIIAEPFDNNITPYYDNNIIKLIEENIITEVTYE